ncbi:hypothetical protein SO802_028419 [Lithocarpus litseifolius]|uniref:peroxidase n=1 Tax=Lithocarpus litseifolius TaxID=425828 RepID=A0AAW2BTF2_9ROSI
MWLRVDLNCHRWHCIRMFLLNYGNHQILLGFLCFYVYDGVNVIFARDLKNKCPQNTGNDDPTVPLDVLTPYRLDNKYYINLKNHHGLLTSDQSLLSRPSTVGIVRNNARQGEAWAYKFVAAMRLLRKNVVFTRRTDEHGEKIASAAAAWGSDPSEHCDVISQA